MRNKAQDLKRQQLADIKKILTPEQYTRFLEQNYINKGPKHAARGNFKHHKFRKDEKFGKRFNIEGSKIAKADKNAKKADKRDRR